MSDQFWLTWGAGGASEALVSRGTRSSAGRWPAGGSSGIIYVQRDGRMWRDAPAVHGRPKTLYDRWKRWSRMGVFARILLDLAAEAPDTETLMIDATHLKARRAASSPGGKKGALATGGDV